MCSVLTNLVLSLETKPIRCATMQCHFGRTWNGYVATHFILLSSTAKSSAAGGYVGIPEGFGQNENQLVEMRKGLRKNLVLFLAVDLFDAIWKHMQIWTSSFICLFFILCILLIFGEFFVISAHWKSFWSFVHVIIYCVGAGVTTLMSFLTDYTRTFFCQKMEKRRSMNEE